MLLEKADGSSFRLINSFATADTEDEAVGGFVTRTMKEKEYEGHRMADLLCMEVSQEAIDATIPNKSADQDTSNDQ